MNDNHQQNSQAATPYEFKRFPREIEKAFTAFRTYLALGPSRSLSAAARTLGKSRTMLHRWSEQFDWAGRISAYTLAQAALTPSPLSVPASAGPSSTNPEIHQTTNPPSPASLPAPPTNPPLPFTPDPKESHKAFQSFLTYFDLGINRSLRQVARTMHVSFATVQLWARRYQWSPRIRAYNTHLLQARIALQTAATQDHLKLQAQRTATFQELEWQAAEKLLTAASLHLDALLAAEPGDVSLSEIARALDIASKIGRLATGLATEKQEHTGPDGGPIRLELTAALNKIYGQPLPDEPIDITPVPPPPAQLPEKPQ